MELKLKRPLLFFDIESTGLNIASDSIVELSFVKILPEEGGANETVIKTWRLCPWDYVNNCQKKMDPGAQKVHGISDDDVKDCPKFQDVVAEIGTFMADSDLAGFNSAKFDLPMLAEEFERVRVYCHKNFKMDLHEKKMVDVQNIFHQREPRNLKAAHIFYCGCDFEGAHGAEADTIATYEVLKGQLDRYPYDKETDPDGLQNDVDWLAQYSTGARKVLDYAGRIALSANDEPIVNFGKHKGKPAKQVWEEDPSYFDWVEKGDFTLDTKRQFANLKEQYMAEMRARAGRPASEASLQGLMGKFNGGKLF
ncbi:MAG: 3'-5' exonuclease [Bacteroidales bacterium]|nr:3'-5' exonuclease [Bacteroidales bacterium]